MMQREKKFSVSIEPDVPKEPKTYSDYLVRSTRDYLLIDLADREETEGEINITVKQSIGIPADAMRGFLMDIIDQMLSYEKLYNNGKGLELAEDFPN